MSSPVRSMESEPSGGGAGDGTEPRERILQTAYQLFSRDGVHAVGIDRIVAEAGVAKMSLYRHFHSKGELVQAVLARHEELWTRDWLEREVQRRARTPEERLLAVFDLFGEWFRGRDYRGCLFVNSLLEAHDRRGPIGAAAIQHLATARSLIRRWGSEAGVDDAAGFAREWQILMFGSIVAAAGGDTQAARRARGIATHLLSQRRS